MQTGIIRRIDHLGRVVIPKEIRKTLRISEGDPLEIFTGKEELVFKKYSPVKNIESLAGSVAKSLEEITQKACVITDTDKIIYATSKLKGYQGQSISGQIQKAIRNKKSVMVSKKEGGEILPLYIGEQNNFENQIIVPITLNGDCYGAVILLDNEEEKPTNSEVRLVRLSASLLSKEFNI